MVQTKTRCAIPFQPVSLFYVPFFRTINCTLRLRLSLSLSLRHTFSVCKDCSSIKLITKIELNALKHFHRILFHIRINALNGFLFSSRLSSGSESISNVLTMNCILRKRFDNEVSLKQTRKPIFEWEVIMYLWSWCGNHINYPLFSSRFVFLPLHRTFALICLCISSRSHFTSFLYHLLFVYRCVYIKQWHIFFLSFYFTIASSFHLFLLHSTLRSFILVCYFCLFQFHYINSLGSMFFFLNKKKFKANDIRLESFFTLRHTTFLCSLRTFNFNVIRIMCVYILL